MIEFKQIIGCGTWLYEGKDYFTIYDFVMHHHFNDPEWDGEPVDPAASPWRKAPIPAFARLERLVLAPNAESDLAE
ncbi:MAG: hypothetical protein U0S12_08645 [Fimbriimonadales bacterium]